MQFAFNLAVVTACLSLPTSIFGQQPLANSKLTWELVPAGYLEPRIVGELGFEALSQRFTDEELMLATHDSDCFALAYVLLVKKKGLARSLPVKKHIDKVEALFLELRVDVIYERSSDGFTKSVIYPNAEQQQQKLINASQIIVSAINQALPKPNAMQEVETVGLHQGRAIPGLRPHVEFVSMSPRVVVEGNPQWKELPHWKTLAASIEKSDDWKGAHVLLSEKFYPGNQQVESTSIGFKVNCNGLTVCITKNQDAWKISYPDEERERIELAEFWALRIRAKKSMW